MRLGKGNIKVDLVLGCFTKKYTQFSGRARRKEFWFFQLAYVIVLILAFTIDWGLASYQEVDGYGVVSTISSIALIMPGIAVAVRRLHDINRKGWWFLINFIPIIGAMVYLVFVCLKGTNGENKFGPDPLVE